MQLLRFRALPLALVLALGACSDEKSTTEVDASIAGTYSLQTVGGNALPYVIFNSGGTSRSIVSRTLTVNANGTFTQETTYRETSSSQDITTTETLTGTFTSGATGLMFTLPPSGTGASTLIIATHASDTLTFGSAGAAQVYTRM